MSPWVLVAFGSALGGVARYGCGVVVAQRFGQSFPWGTLTVNVMGSLAIGVCGALANENRAGATVIRDFLMIGFLGGFTTFSAFSLQTLQLLRDGKGLLAAGNVTGSVVMCLLAVWLGYALTERLAS